VVIYYFMLFKRKL